MRTVFIVSRRHEDLYIYLRQRFASDPDVTVILDRRVTAHSDAGEPASRSAERRGRPCVDAELRLRSHAILTLADSPNDR
jgi:hypothetical protein